MITAQRIEDALLVLATIIAARDDAFADRIRPVYDRLEREFEACKRDDVRARARARLAAARTTINGGPPA